MSENNELAPMNIYEAIEVMKILLPHRTSIVEETDKSVIKGILALLKGIRNSEPGALLRLIALNQHIKVEKAAELYGDWEGKEILGLLAEMFVVNPIPDLFDGALVLGLTTEGWQNARD